MAADPFNSLGGFTVGIPPLPVIDTNGNITTNYANILNLEANSATFTGNITANTFVGNFSGNITGNIIVPGPTTGVVYNNSGFAASDNKFIYDTALNRVTIQGDLIANTVTMGYGPVEFCTTRILFASTVSNASNQVLQRIKANTICSVDYTVIATDLVGNNRQTCKLFASILGDEVAYYEFGSIDVPMSGPGVGDFKVQYDSANSDVVLTVTPIASTLVSYKIMTTSYKE